MISLKPIRENAGPPAYTRGNQVYKRGLVHEFTSANQGSLIEAEAQVEGSHDNSYHVKLVYDRVSVKLFIPITECASTVLGRLWSFWSRNRGRQGKKARRNLWAGRSGKIFRRQTGRWLILFVPVPQKKNLGFSRQRSQGEWS